MHVQEPRFDIDRFDDLILLAAERAAGRQYHAKLDFASRALDAQHNQRVRAGAQNASAPVVDVQCEARTLERCVDLQLEEFLALREASRR